MNLFELTKDLGNAAAKHCELVDGIRIKSVGTRYKQHENPKEDYFEQDVVVRFTRRVRQDSHEFGYLVDNIGMKDSWNDEEKNAYLHRMYNGNSTGADKQNGYNKMQSEYTFLNYHTYNVFRNRMIRFFNEEKLEVSESGMVRVPMDQIRDEIKEAIPVAGMMLPLDLFEFIRKMFNNMDLFNFNSYCSGFEKSSFRFQAKDLREYGIKNPCLEVVSE